MTKEMDEQMREKIAGFVAHAHYRFEGITTHWDKLSPENRLLWQREADQILSLETDTCRIRILPKTKIVCLCGSTRFTEEMLVKQWELTKQGFIVLSWCALPDWYFTGGDKAHVGDQEGVKEIVDTVHMRKIYLADMILVLNKNGYIGESTKRELEYAQRLGKPVVFLESEAGFVQEVRDEL